jgi:hypothetical protein
MINFNSDILISKWNSQRGLQFEGMPFKTFFGILGKLHPGAAGNSD